MVHEPEKEKTRPCRGQMALAYTYPGGRLSAFRVGPALQWKGDLHEALIVGDEPRHDLLDLDELLDQLASADPRAAELVKLRFFAGLTGDQAAEVLGIAPRSADLLWAYARAWLFERLQGESC